MQGVVGLRGKLIRCGLVLQGKGNDKAIVFFGAVFNRPRAANPEIVRSTLGQVKHLDGVHAIAADNRHVKPELTRLHHDGRTFSKQCRQHNRIGISGLNLGELGFEVHIAFGKGFGCCNRKLLCLNGLFEVVVSALGEHIVVAVQDGDAFDIRGFDSSLDGDRQHVGFGDRIAEHKITDGSDTVRRIGGAKHHHLGGLGHGVCSLRRVGQRRAEQHQHFVLEDQLLKRIDRLFLFTLLVFHDQNQLVTVYTTRSVNFLSRQLEPVANADSILRRSAGQGFGHTDLDISRVS